MNIRRKLSLRRVSRREFLAAMKDLRQIAREHGAELVFRRRRPVKNRYGALGPNYGEIGGAYDMIQRRASVTLFGRTSYSEILHVCAHEVRHAIHHATNMYRNYYKDYSGVLEACSKVDASIYPDRLPNLTTAIQAERDCDQWASSFLAERLMGYGDGSAYPFRKTMAADLHINWYCTFGWKAYLDKTSGMSCRLRF